MDINTQIQANQAIGYLQNQTTQLANLSNQIASGDQLQTPSDNPVAYVSVLQDTAQNARYTTDLSNITTATDTLNSSVSGLNSVQTLLTQANTLLQQGINSNNTQSENTTLAAQLNDVLNSLVSTANTQVNGQYIFGGTATTKAPYAVSSTDSSGNTTAVTYQGSSEAGQTLIGPGQTVDTTNPINTALQAPGTDIFQALITARDALSNGTLSNSSLSQTLTTQLATLQQGASNVENAIGSQSASLQNLSTLQSQLQSLQLSTQTATSNLQSTNYTSALVQYNALQNVFQSTLATSAKIFNTSLLNFIQ